jgi:anti-sigma regulatory factor (Ser/Thr protein kinase)
MPGGNPRPTAGHGAHMVQFYGDDEELSAGVGTFLGEGLAEGCPAVMVATSAHRAAVRAELGAGTEGAGLLLVDAAELLASFLVGGRIDPARFREAVGGLIGRAADAGQPVRIYAEMVALLWDAGQVTLALQLEVLWNELASRLPFRLLCGYPARLMTEHDDAEAVCRLHSGVITGEAARDFPADRESAREARHFVLDVLGSRVDRAVAVDASIVTAELAANAVLHARSPFAVAVSHSAACVRICVRDSAPLLDRAALEVSPGHGLGVVAQVASRWAVEPLPGGKMVWAELPASPRN